MNTLELLIQSRARIADERHWCQKAFARDATGDSCYPYVAYADAWCALGSVRATASKVQCGTPTQFAAEAALGEAARELGYDGIVGANDGTETWDGHPMGGGTHEDVLKVYDRAIENA